MESAIIIGAGAACIALAPFVAGLGAHYAKRRRPVSAGVAFAFAATLAALPLSIMFGA
jgi:hypothetical protein